MSEQPKRGAQIHMSYHGAPVILTVTDKPLGDIEQLIDGLLARDGWAAHAPAVTANGSAQKPRADRVAPEWNRDNEPVCPVHKKVLKEGMYGLYCPSKATGAAGETVNEKGYCSIKFKEIPA